MRKALGLLIIVLFFAVVIGGLINVFANNAEQRAMAYEVVCQPTAEDAKKETAKKKGKTSKRAAKRAAKKKKEKEKEKEKEKTCRMQLKFENRTPIGQRYEFVTGPNDVTPVAITCQRSLIVYGPYSCERE